jgi:uncharacterized membrane protein YdjX (TVP38/TMEM64 family)
MDTKVIKRALCVIPGIGTPISIYYFISSSELRRAATKGLLLLPSSAVLIAISVVLPIPGPILLLAGAYLYWGVIALVAGAGFLSLFLAEYFVRRAPKIKTKKEEETIKVSIASE